VKLLATNGDTMGALDADELQECKWEIMQIKWIDWIRCEWIKFRVIFMLYLTSLNATE